MCVCTCNFLNHVSYKLDGSFCFVPEAAEGKIKPVNSQNSRNRLVQKTACSRSLQHWLQLIPKPGTCTWIVRCYSNCSFFLKDKSGLINKSEGNPKNELVLTKTKSCFNSLCSFISKKADKLCFPILLKLNYWEK